MEKELNEKFSIPSAYFYKGATCSNIILERDIVGGIILRNDYNEVMTRCLCGSEIAQFIIDLQSNKFA